MLRVIEFRLRELQWQLARDEDAEHPQPIPLSPESGEDADAIEIDEAQGRLGWSLPHN